MYNTFHVSIEFSHQHRQLCKFKERVLPARADSQLHTMPGRQTVAVAMRRTQRGCLLQRLMFWME